MIDTELLAKASTLVPAVTPCETFENAIRSFGIVAACEWFGYQSNSEFTAETVCALAAESEAGNATESNNLP